MEKQKHILDEQRLEWLAFEVNRSNGQVSFLYNLVDGDWDKLLALEYKLKNNFLSYCPGDKESVAEVMSMELKSDWFQFRKMPELVKGFNRVKFLEYDVKALELEVVKLKEFNEVKDKEIRELKKK